MAGVRRLTPVEALVRYKAGARLIDVRSEAEQASGMAEGAEAISQDLLLEDAASRLPPDAEILLICQRGMRSLGVAEAMLKQGFVDIASIEGGIEAWLRLAEAVGLDREQVLSQELVLPGVRFAVDAYVNFARRACWQEAASSSLTELFAPTIHQSRLDSWPQHYPWIDASGYDYFRKRLKEARRDVEHGLRITLDHYRTREAQERMLEILQFKLDVLWSMLDAMGMADELDRPPYHTVTRDRVWHKGISF